MEVLRLIDESRLPVADGMQVPTVATVLNMTHYCLLFGFASSEGKVAGPVKPLTIVPSLAFRTDPLRNGDTIKVGR